MDNEQRPKVYISRRIPQVGISRLEQSCDVDVWRVDLPPERETVLSSISGCSALLTMLSDRVDGEMMDAAGPQLRVIANFGVGYNNIDVEEASRRKIRVGNTPGVLTDATADIAFALLIAAARRVTEGERLVRAEAWKTWEPLGLLGYDLVGKTLGVVGLGRIGQAMARRCHRGRRRRAARWGAGPHAHG